ncbi:PREDICTED: PRD1 [Prunus dulcis]|uniref:PREDICTED: PRD1 n=1 Tax=Prunus dulcis TaxID=3755 RepID=A0A5E4G8H2_PRUDU|nr:PREDICTED: PRD1 [Prunus dulcis]
MNSQSQELLRDYHENEEEEASNCLRQRAHRAIAPRSSSESSKAAASASPTSSPTCSRVLRPLSALSGHLLRPPFLCSLLAFHPHFLVSLLVHALSSFDDDPIARQVVHLVSALCESAAASLSSDFVARVSDRLSSGALAWSLRHLYTQWFIQRWFSLSFGCLGFFPTEKMKWSVYQMLGSLVDATLCLPSDPIDFLILLEQKNSRNLELSSCQSAISLISYTSSLYDERLADDKLVLASLEKYILWLFQQEKLSTPLSYQLLKFSGKNIANGIIVHGKNSHMVNVNLIAELIAGGDNHGSTLLVSLLTQLLEKGHENDIISEVNLVATIVNIFPIASDQLCLHVHHEILSDDECCLAVTMKVTYLILAIPVCLLPQEFNETVCLLL